MTFLYICIAYLSSEPNFHSAVLPCCDMGHERACMKAICFRLKSVFALSTTGQHWWLFSPEVGVINHVNIFRPTEQSFSIHMNYTIPELEDLVSAWFFSHIRVYHYIKNKNKRGLKKLHTTALHHTKPEYIGRGLKKLHTTALHHTNLNT
jgi:hypothetical protein